MNNSLGAMIAKNFMAAEPTADSILELMSGKSAGWDGMNASDAGKPMREQVNSAADDLKRCYAQIYSTPAGQKVIDDLLSQSLRRAPAHPGGNVPMDQQTAYILERMGQNGMMTYIMRMIFEGANLPAPAAPRTRRRSNKA